MPAIRVAALLGAAIVVTANAGPGLSGQWGAPGADLNVGVEGARLEQDCAGGSFGPVTLDPKGRFKTTGHFEIYRAGPQLENEMRDGNAVFEGAIMGDTLQLTVRPSDGVARTLTLTRGKRVKLIRCY